MKIKYLNGYRIYNAIYAGSKAIIENQSYLNKINVFPVPDSDTGTNMASTVHSIMEGSDVYRSLKRTLQSIADAALSGARGNSGIILAQFFYGFSEEIQPYHRISVDVFAQSVDKAIKHVYESMLEPIEGTIITVMKEWGKSICLQSNHTSDFAKLFHESLEVAKKALQETPNQLKTLAKAGVVDAGASGFVKFLEGVAQFIQNGKLRRIVQNEFKISNFYKESIHDFNEDSSRYCTEAMITNSKINIRTLQSKLKKYGTSVITAGSQKKIHLHIHTDNPEELFAEINQYGNISQLKVDDMKMQYEISKKPKDSIALITDSACDLPKKMLEKHHIMQIPFNLYFGKIPYLDKVTISTNQFYKKMEGAKVHPKSSQPSFKTVDNMYSFISNHFQNIIGIHISNNLSGMYKIAKSIENNFSQKNIAVLDSKQLTVSQGLIVLRAAEAIEAGISFSELTKKIDRWIDKTEIYVDVNTLKYMVRGGRVSPLKGLLASLLNIKPIVGLDKNGKASIAGKSFSRNGNMKKILKIIAEKLNSKKIWRYAIVHADAKKRAEIYADKLTKLIGQEPAYIMELSPVIGVHNGIGAIGIGIMED